MNGIGKRDGEKGQTGTVGIEGSVREKDRVGGAAFVPHCKEAGLEFSEILQMFLKENGLTQTKFAGIVGVKQSQVSEWLKGKAKPGYDLLKQMAKAFGISADYFLGLTDGY